VAILEAYKSQFFSCNLYSQMYKSSFYARCPGVAKKLHNLFVIKDINFFFLDDASTAFSENIAVYIQSVPIL
jgi:hypothetical protein